MLTKHMKVGGLGHSPHKYLEFYFSEVDSGAFWIENCVERLPASDVVVD